MQKPTTYKESGVDVHTGEIFVNRIKHMVKGTYNKRVYQGIGGFASLYQIDDQKFLATGTDGVGTKLKIAQMLNIHHTIGIDLVAMCVNDILCTGAQPLFFLDYLATGKLNLDINQEIIKGIVEGCQQSQMALIGGETAEMPGMYSNGEYDLAGFAVGEVYKSQIIDGTKACPGNTIIGLSSSGLHSNGFSLVRKLFNRNETDILKSCLTPTRIYSKIVQNLLANDFNCITGIAHITGGGFLNIGRINSQLNYDITNTPPLTDISEIFSHIQDRASLSSLEMYQTFNMGIGLVITTNNPDTLCKLLVDQDEKYWILGKTTNGNGKVKLYGQDLSI